MQQNLNKTKDIHSDTKVFTPHRKKELKQLTAHTPT